MVPGWQAPLSVQSAAPTPTIRSLCLFEPALSPSLSFLSPPAWMTLGFLKMQDCPESTFGHANVQDCSQFQGERMLRVDALHCTHVCSVYQVWEETFEFGLCQTDNIQKLLSACNINTSGAATPEQLTTW